MSGALDLKVKDCGLVCLAQVLARHSDINLTLNVYTRLQMSELAVALDKLPKLQTSVQAAEQNLARAS
jgi:hypothetical protein